MICRYSSPLRPLPPLLLLLLLLFLLAFLPPTTPFSQPACRSHRRALSLSWGSKANRRSADASSKEPPPPPPKKKKKKEKKKKNDDDTNSNDEKKGKAAKQKKAKIRVDELLVSRSIVDDAKAAKALVMAGDVFVRGDHRVDSAALKLEEDTPLRIRTKRDHPWVSRGGLKLQHALDDCWPAQLLPLVEGATCLDVGSSTGGFTDVLLARGAKRVFAVDVGYCILDWRLRNDRRVLVRERLNARELQPSHLTLLPEEQKTEGVEQAGGGREGVVEANHPSPPEEPSFLVCDASFIRLSTVLPAAMALCGEGATLVALVKPQFEAFSEEVEPGGVVRDPEVHKRVCDGAREWLASVEQVGEGEGGGSPARRFRWRVDGLERSPVLGPAGNVEFLLLGTKVAVEDG